MKVHRIIAIIEVENDNSITSVEVTNLHPTNNDIPLAVTNITTNGSAKDIEQVYNVIDDYRIVIRDKLKSIARTIDNGLDDYECGIIGRDDDKTSYVSELTTTHLVKQDDVGMTNVNGADTDIAHGHLLL